MCFYFLLFIKIYCLVLALKEKKICYQKYITFDNRCFFSLQCTAATFASIVVSQI